MNDKLEKMWDEYFYEKCAVIETKEERDLLIKASEVRDALNTLLTNNQTEILEKFIRFTYEIQSLQAKKAFFLGCNFTSAFFTELQK